MLHCLTVDVLKWWPWTNYTWK